MTVSPFDLTYEIQGNGYVKGTDRQGIVYWIPPAANNPDYQLYQDWLAVGSPQVNENG